MYSKSHFYVHTYVCVRYAVLHLANIIGAFVWAIPASLEFQWDDVMRDGRSGLCDIMHRHAHSHFSQCISLPWYSLVLFTVHSCLPPKCAYDQALSAPNDSGPFRGVIVCVTVAR